MSVQDTEAAETAEQEAEEQTTEEPQEGTEDQGSEDWRSNFDADKAADRIRKLQSEAKNLRERAKAAEKKAEGVDEKDQRITSLEGELLRERVGRRLHLPDELVDRLRGSTEEEILADAEKLVAIVGKARGGGKPTESLRGGGEPDEEPVPDLTKVVDAIPR
jgi:signal recognition particle GTPase